MLPSSTTQYNLTVLFPSPGFDGLVQVMDGIGDAVEDLCDHIADLIGKAHIQVQISNRSCVALTLPCAIPYVTHRYRRRLLERSLSICRIHLERGDFIPRLCLHVAEVG